MFTLTLLKLIPCVNSTINNLPIFICLEEINLHSNCVFGSVRDVKSRFIRDGKLLIFYATKGSTRNIDSAFNQLWEFYLPICLKGSEHMIAKLIQSTDLITPKYVRYLPGLSGLVYMREIYIIAIMRSLDFLLKCNLY